MRFILVLAGLLTAVFVLPLFMDLWEGLVKPLTEHIDNVALQLFFTAIPYLVLVVTIISAFLIMSGRREA